ncbi:hypothetical protein D3C79_610880 [compost metagenome]
MLLRHRHLLALLLAEAAEQLIQLLAHATHGGIHISRCLLHLLALLTANRGHAFHKVAYQAFQHLSGLLAGGADQGLNGRRHDVVQGISECGLHRLVHAGQGFLQALADALVQLLQRLLALLAVFGDVHQRLLGGNARIQRIHIVLQRLNPLQRRTLEHLLDEVEQQAEQHTPDRRHKGHGSTGDQLVDPALERFDLARTANQPFQTNGQTDEGAQHADGHQKAWRCRQQTAGRQTTSQRTRVEEVLGIQRVEQLLLIRGQH